MTDMTHLHTLEMKLFNEKERLTKSKNQNEINLRKVWIQQLEKEIDGEKKFLGLENTKEEIEMTDEQLLENLFSK